MERRSELQHRDPPSQRVVEEVAAYSDTSAMELPPLYDTVDPDALDALFRSDEMDGRVVFTYDAYEVTVGSDQGIELRSFDG